jgi:hypothetical protein
LIETGAEKKIFCLDAERADVTPTVAVSIDNTDVNVADVTATVTFAFSEAPTSFALADTNAVGGTLSNLQQTDATHYTATFTGTTNTDISNASVNVTTAAGDVGLAVGRRMKVLRLHGGRGVSRGLL